jgi:hypothetical protein
VSAPFHPEWRAPHAAVAAVAEGKAEYVTRRKRGAAAREG